MLSNHVFAPINSGIMYLNNNEQISRTNEYIDKPQLKTQNIMIIKTSEHY